MFGLLTSLKKFNSCSCPVFGSRNINFGICGFDFEAFYGELGKNYIHVHHIVPLSKINKEYSVDPKNDLVPVCPNCHAMIHRTEPALTIDALKKQIVEFDEIRTVIE